MSTDSHGFAKAGVTSMYELSPYTLTRAQRLDLVYYVSEILAYGKEPADYRDDIREGADSHVPVINVEARHEWLAMGCPDPFEFDGWEKPDEIADKNIIERMKLGIALSNIDFCERLFAEAETREQALEIGNAYLAAHGWNTWAPGGLYATYGNQHGKQEEECTQCPTHCHD